MHIVTKILVILATILSVLLAGLSIAYTSNAQRIKGELRTERQRATAAEATASEAAQAGAAEREVLQEKIATLEASLQEATSRLAGLQGDNARLLAEVNSLKQNQATYSGQIDQFTSVIRTYAALNESQSAELETLRSRALDANRKEIALSDRINDLQGELEVARETTRSLQEQLVALREQADRGGLADLGPAGAGAAGFLRAPSNFRARVTAVDRDPAGNTLVEISGGASDKLREGMRLNITRDGSNWVGAIVVERVNINDSIARVAILGDHGEVRAGDIVIPTL